MSDGTFLYPNVTSLPGQSGLNPADRARKQEGVSGEFDQVLEKVSDLSHVKQPLKFSSHASQRLRDRKIQMDPATLAKVNEAVDRAEAKGIEDALIISKDSALIISVKNRTVVTALDRNSLSGNVFTNIDGAVIV
jgi:flagellar operon protein